ncbi:magnesium and cobalt transport protein CorA [Bernardetia sp.]|uniref:magnesium and cobalt transport protein CorA n=1 Tax=Bernardetia sp. TaxID=1937974 RepID=UPI0025C36880|nr:magnesium and cobalt transport protein CorA [Bernardetia sp.]
MEKEFLQNTTLIQYNQNEYLKRNYDKIEDIDVSNTDGSVRWLNTYGMDDQEELKQVILQNNLDDFLLKLIKDEEQSNKVIELENLLFVSIRVLKTQNDNLDSEQMFFIVSPDFVWSIQEEVGDYFGWIRERIRENKGIIRKKKADYLLFFLIESIIDNYYSTHQSYVDSFADLLDTTRVKPTPEFTNQIEKQRRDLLKFKKSANSLRTTLLRLEKIKHKNIKTSYFAELKEQANDLITDIDFELQTLESSLNLVFSIQGHRLNEVMKTLTIFSVIFIPLTFLAGIYGMNFENIPELKTQNGYFILLGVMAIITLAIIYYFKRKNWF